MARGLGKKRAAPGAASRLIVGMLLVSVHAAQARSADEACVCSAAPGPTNALVAKEQRQSACIELVAEPTPAFAAAPKATKSGSSWSAFLQSVPQLVHGAATHLALVVGSALLLSSAVTARGGAARSSAWCVVRYLLVSDSLVRAAAPQDAARDNIINNSPGALARGPSSNNNNNLPSVATGVVPQERRQLTGYVMTDSNIYTARDAWLADATAAEAEYGHISTWETSGVTDMSYLFCASSYDEENCNTAAAPFNEDISGWDTSGVKDMKWMFKYASSFDQDISGWDVSNVESMWHMFKYAAVFNQDLSGWQVDKVNDMDSMFNEAVAFDQNLGWCVDDDVDLEDAFEDAPCESTSCGVVQGDFCAPTPRPTPQPSSQPTQRPTPAPAAPGNPTARPVPAPNSDVRQAWRRADRKNHGESYCHPSRAGLRCQGLGPDKRCWIKESCKPDPTVQTLTLTRTTVQRGYAESATCYGRRYPDLMYNFCEDGCDVRMLHKHFRDHGRAEGRSFGCEAPALSEQEWNQFEAGVARESSGYAGPGFWNSRDFECGDTQLRLARSVRGSQPVCRRVGGLCGCDLPAGRDERIERLTEELGDARAEVARLEALLGAAAVEAAAEPLTSVASVSQKEGPRVCAVVRTYADHAEVLGPELQTMRAAARVVHCVEINPPATRLVAAAGARLEVHLLNTDARDVGPWLRMNVAHEVNRSDMEDGFEIHNHFDGTIQKRAAAWLQEHGIKEDYGYVQTDLALLELRKRGGCDFIHVTNGDNLHHVDFFRRHLDAMRDPTVVATAVDFYCHQIKKFVEVAYRVGRIDLATQIFRAAYLDARNATFITGPYERDCKNQKCDLSAYFRSTKELSLYFRKKLANVDWQNLGVDSEWSRLRIFNADGHFAKDISRDVGPSGRRAIHGHGPLLWHL